MLLLLLSHLCPAQSAEPGRVWRIDDFEDRDLRSPSGLFWIPLADELVGGTSVATLDISTSGDAGSRGALKVTGRLSDGDRAFLAVWAPLAREGRPLDLSGFEGIRIRIRSSGRLMVGFRDTFINYMAPIEAGAGWRTVEVPFKSLEPIGRVPEGTRWHTDSQSWFGLSTPPAGPGEKTAATDITFEIDDIELFGKGDGPAEPPEVGPPGQVAVFPFAPLGSIPLDGWVELATDPAGDANAPALPDATRLEVHQQQSDELIWFRMTLRETPHDRYMGVNVAVDLDGDRGNGQAWWGANKDFKFDRLLSVWCFRVEAGCMGTIGVADADRVAAGAMGGDGATVRFAIDVARRAYVVGVPRKVLQLGSRPARVVGAVGSALLFGDDVPSKDAAILR